MILMQRVRSYGSTLRLFPWAFATPKRLLPHRRGEAGANQVSGFTCQVPSEEFDDTAPATLTPETTDLTPVSAPSPQPSPQGERG